MVTQLQPDVRAYLHGGEVIKRYISWMEIWKKDSACCVRIINHRGREVRPYPQKAKRGDSASDNSEGRRETHFVARL